MANLWRVRCGGANRSMGIFKSEVWRLPPAKKDCDGEYEVRIEPGR